MFKGNVDKVSKDASEIARRLREGNVTMSELRIEYHCRYGTLVKAVQKLLSAVEYKTLITKETGHPGKRGKRKVDRLAGGNNKGECRNSKPPSSQYLGVIIKQGKSGPRYYAQSARGGVFKNLDAHNVEELAAAAVQEHLGNNKEAGRLRKIAREKTDTAIKELKGQTGQQLLLCSGCGADYEKRPEKCVKCGGGSFEPFWRNAKAG